MEDNWGNPTRGYVAKNGKTVKNFVNPNSIEWMSELWATLLPDQPEYYKKKYIKALRTRGLNMLKDSSSIWGIRFFIEFLIKEDSLSREMMEQSKNEEKVDIVFEGFEDEAPF